MTKGKTNAGQTSQEADRTESVDAGAGQLALGAETDNAEPDLVSGPDPDAGSGGISGEAQTDQAGEAQEAVVGENPVGDPALETAAVATVGEDGTAGQTTEPAILTEGGESDLVALTGAELQRVAVETLVTIKAMLAMADGPVLGSMGPAYDTGWGAAMNAVKQAGANAITRAVDPVV
jgi:hypothetical protein